MATLIRNYYIASFKFSLYPSFYKILSARPYHNWSGILCVICTLNKLMNMFSRNNTIMSYYMIVIRVLCLINKGRVNVRRGMEVGLALTFYTPLASMLRGSYEL